MQSIQARAAMHSAVALPLPAAVAMPVPAAQPQMPAETVLLNASRAAEPADVKPVVRSPKLEHPSGGTHWRTQVITNRNHLCTAAASESALHCNQKTSE